MMLFAPPPPPPDPAFALRLKVAKPMGKGRPRASIFNGKPMLRTPKATRDMERDITRAAHTSVRINGFGSAKTEKLKTGRVVLAGPLYALVVGVWPRIKKMPDPKHSGRQWRPSVPDWDNVAKLALDALNGVALKDDSQVVWGQARTVYAAAGESAAIEVYLWQAAAYPPEVDTFDHIPF